MMRLRLLPILMFALASLLVLKVAGLLGHAGVEVGGPPPAHAEDAPGGFGRAIANARTMPPDLLVTGSVSKKKDPAPETPATVPAQDDHAATDHPADDHAAAEDARPAVPAPPVETAEPMLPSATQTATSPSERALLERLQQRREQLDQQARELDMRENLLKATEKRIEDRVEELKQLQTSVGTAQQQQDDANVARLKGLVTMYEAMKPKDAARIFDRLDMAILIDVAGAMKPAKLGDVLAAMDSDAAQKLTVALANRSLAKSAPAGQQTGADLPKIEGQAPAN